MQCKFGITFDFWSDQVKVGIIIDDDAKFVTLWYQ